jgi:hypothetical protein
MRAAILTFCGLMSLACFGFAAGADIVPKKLTAFAGNTWVGPYHVALEGDTLLYWHGGPKDRASAERLKPSLKSWREFRRELDAIRIWRWHSDYSTHAVYDATGWIFEIDYSDCSIKTGGDSGVFPDRDGTARTDTSEQYMRYVKALQKLLSRDTFPQ